jgi:hypothetical protein
VARSRTRRRSSRPRSSPYRRARSGGRCTASAGRHARRRRTPSPTITTGRSCRSSRMRRTTSSSPRAIARRRRDRGGRPTRSATDRRSPDTCPGSSRTSSGTLSLSLASPAACTNASPSTCAAGAHQHHISRLHLLDRDLLDRVAPPQLRALRRTLDQLRQLSLGPARGRVFERGATGEHQPDDHSRELLAEGQGPGARGNHAIRVTTTHPANAQAERR